MYNHTFVEWHEVAQTFTVFDYVREMAAKKFCDHRKYGSFEHLLFLFDLSLPVKGVVSGQLLTLSNSLQFMEPREF